MSESRKININTQSFIETVAGAALRNELVGQSKVNFIEQQGDKQLIVIAASPKSGSTYLSNTLCKITGYKYFRLCSGYSTNEHDLYLPALCLMNQYGCVSQLHMKGTYHNHLLLKQFGIRPIILIRNIFDAVISLKYDLRKKQQNNAYSNGQDGYSFLWQDDSITKLDDPALIDAIIDLALPWYVNFYVSWYRLCEQGLIDALWITYEELFEDKEHCLNSIIAFLSSGRSADKPYTYDKSILSAKYGTFRSGKKGEGGEELSKRQKENIQKKFLYYSDIDFSKLGI